MSDICEHGVNFYKRRCYKCSPREPKAQISLAQAAGSVNRPFDQQTDLERTIRAILWQPQDRLKRAESSLSGHVKRKEFREAADCQSAMRKAASEIATWDSVLKLYEQERETLASPDSSLRESEIESLLREVMRIHADSNSPEYNECDNATCNWCVRASRVIGQNTKL